MKNLRIQKKLVLTSLAMAVVAFGVITACTDGKATAKPNFVFKETSDPTKAAKIGGEEITEDQLISNDRAGYFEIKKKEYDLKMSLLKQLLVERLIGAEAKKANLELDAFITQKVLKGEPKISTSEYEAFLKEKKISKSQVNDQLKERINAFLKERKREQAIDAYIAKLTKDKPVEVYFKKPRMNVDIEVGNAPVWGNAKAPVTIVEFSDFQCPFCSRAAETVDKLKKKYSGKVRIAFKHFPLPMHREAKPAAEASMCVNEQDTKKFWKFHDLAFKNQDKLDGPSLEKYAKDAGADLAKFKTCMDSKKYAAAVEADMQYGEKLGVRSTPTFFVNGQLLSGSLPLEEFTSTIDDELHLAKQKK